MLPVSAGHAAAAKFIPSLLGLHVYLLVHVCVRACVGVMRVRAYASACVSGSTCAHTYTHESHVHMQGWQ